jgi:hypothetical protein
MCSVMYSKTSLTQANKKRVAWITEKHKLEEFYYM